MFAVRRPPVTIGAGTVSPSYFQIREGAWMPTIGCIVSLRESIDPPIQREGY